MQKIVKYLSKCKSKQENQEKPGKLNLKPIFISHVYIKKQDKFMQICLEKNAEMYLYEYILALGLIPHFSHNSFHQC